MDHFISPPDLQIPESGQVTWRAPSNIALVKYWGKKGIQLPQNPSLSFTLKNCCTTTTLEYKKSDRHDLDVYVDGTLNKDFKPKISQFFERALPYCPFIKNYSFEIKTSNSFPHSSGIASSASGMAALALCLVDIEQGTKQKASFLARLGSGSACRSVGGGLIVWGEHKNIPDSSDFYGIPYPHSVHDVFQSFQDTILLIDQGQKQVSSSVGHGLMKNHPFASARFDQGRRHIDELQLILENGDLDGFIKIVEAEALTLHAMMLTSDPNFILMKPNTLIVIEKISTFRIAHQVPVCFTLDAGANVHCLYPKAYQEQVQNFIKEELIAYCQNGAYIDDEIGMGAEKQ